MRQARAASTKTTKSEVNAVTVTVGW